MIIAYSLYSCLLLFLLLTSQNRCIFTVNSRHSDPLVSVNINGYKDWKRARIINVDNDQSDRVLGQQQQQQQQRQQLPVPSSPLKSAMAVASGQIIQSKVIGQVSD